jgi:hypothetical protein
VGIIDQIKNEGLRKTINERPGASAAAGAVLIVLACLFIIYELRPAARPSPFAGKAFFSDDDGLTFFVDKATLIPPFDHNGKPAYRCRVYQCEGGQPFVNHLERYTPQDKATLEEIISRTGEAASSEFMKVSGHMEVKMPGGGDLWIPLNSDTAQMYMMISRPHAPPGCTPDKLKQVIPQ